VIKQFILRHFPIIAIVALILSCTLVGDELTLLLRFERKAILEGELYRLFSAHIVHLNWAHSLLNITAAVIGWFLLKDSMSTQQWILSIVICGLIISILLFCIPDLQWYVGFSGIVHGLMLQGLVLEQHIRFVKKALLICALFLKVFYEYWQGSSSAEIELINANVVVEAHLFGLLAGLVMIIYIKAMPLYRR
jgi:rhomboid family GlyGly-CTERM serine protease